MLLQIYKDLIEKSGKFTAALPVVRVHDDVRRFVEQKAVEIAQANKSPSDLSDGIRYLIMTHPEYLEHLERHKDK